MSKRDTPNEYYIFVNIEEKRIVSDEDGSYAYWVTEEEALDVVRKIHTDDPKFDLSKFGIAHVTKTYTEFEPGNEMEFLNIDVLYGFSQVL